MKHPPFPRCIIIVLDGLGIGELPDAKDYGDEGSNTIKNMAIAAGPLKIPCLERMGLGLIEEIPGIKKVENPEAFYGKMSEASSGKDTTTGHWEIAGIITKEPFALFPHGFPEEIINQFREITGFDIIGNFPASGTDIIKLLGEEHIKSGRLILYTSADSVFQIAAHEDVVPPEKLYEICRKARDILNRYRVARVIARPFRGERGNFYRTEGRRDFSMPPPEETVLDELKAAGLDVIGVGKIGEIFAGRGLTRSMKSTNNRDTMEKLLNAMEIAEKGLIFANFIDFDMLYGHRNDPFGYARALENMDSMLSEFLGRLRRNDLIFITADHGCDPVTPSTDHSREYVPLLVFSPSFSKTGSLGIRETFADIAQTIRENFFLSPGKWGGSFLSEILF